MTFSFKLLAFLACTMVLGLRGRNLTDILQSAFSWLASALTFDTNSHITCIKSWDLSTRHSCKLNKGIAGHVNHAFKLCSIAAGTDVCKLFSHCLLSFSPPLPPTSLRWSLTCWVPPPWRTFATSPRTLPLRAYSPNTSPLHCRHSTLCPRVPLMELSTFSLKCWSLTL